MENSGRIRTCSEGNADEIDSIGLGCALEFFKEYDEISGLIDQLKDVYRDRSQSEKVTERFIYVLNQYQEQPHLLDRYLDDFLNKLLAISRDTGNDPALQYMAFKFLYVITKVRGYKVVLRHLPHEVSDVEPVLSLLGAQDPRDAGTWEARYVLLLWMSIIVIIPFDMHRLDDGDTAPARTLIQRIMEVIKLYLSVGDKARDAAAFLAAHFVSRPDVRDPHLPEYLAWCKKMLKQSQSEHRLSLQAGILQSLALLFKHGKRDDVEPHGAPLLRHVLACGFEDSGSSVVRKAALKLIQRIGLSFLRVKVARWRYSRGRRSLADNLAAGDARPPEAGTPEGPSEDEDYDIPDETEDVVEQLLVGLRDKDTIIRWSAAKGVGRVTGRLPKELADDVVTSVLELFSLRESDSAWHGGCLALAELGRRGLILPQHLERVVGVVLRALVYDEQRGNFSVGAHIRDAACYVCWSFARAYDPRVLEPHVRGIAGALLVATVFDREITCRRAASAAFQENVGRQGTFPHGIEILTETDYYAVGSRTNSFLNLSVHIAQFPEYTLALIRHLLEHKVGHWDPAVRELAARSLHALTPRDPGWVGDEAVPRLLDGARGVDLNARHGAILALGEVVHALALCRSGEPIEDVLGAQAVGRIRGLVWVLEERGLFRGMGGILMRNAACHLVEKCSLAALPFRPEDDVLVKWQGLLDGCLRHADGGVRASAVSALPHFFRRFYPPGDPRPPRILGEYLEGLRDEHMEARCGFALAIGALPESVLACRAEDVVCALGRCAGDTEAHPEWAEARRDAVRALAGVARSLGTRGLGDPGPLFEALLAATRDYTLDSRGEIGAIVREAAMLAIQEVVTMLVQDGAGEELLGEDLVSRIFCVLVQQCTEKIDRTRAVAGGVFRTLLHSQPRTPHIPHREELLRVFPEELCRDLNWASPGDTFRLFVELLDLPTYTRPLLSGFVVSVGGLTESLVKSSSCALVGYLSSRQEADLLPLCEQLLLLLQENLGSDRVVLPFLKMMNHVLPSGAELPGPAFHERLLALAWEAARRSRDPQKVVAAVDLLCNLLPASEACRRRALNKLAVFLCHRFPRVRKVTASRLYEALVAYDLAPEDDEGGALEILSETDWGAPLEALRPARNRLCAALGLEPPVPRAAPH